MFNSRIEPDPEKIKAETHRDLGKKIGHYWTNFLENLLNDHKGDWHSHMVCKAFFGVDPYLSLGQQEQRAVEALYLGLRATVPDLVDETDGIYLGMCEKWPACRELRTRFELPSLLGCFMMSLGEMEDPHCSSIAMYDQEGRPVLLHSEHGSFADESDDSLELPYPILFADVTLSGRKFFSCSYPFQLLGSAWAASEYLAFTGNSIFSDGARPWDTTRLIPKSYFARKLIDFKSIDEVEDWLEYHIVALPGHFHLIDNTSNSCLSLMIRPPTKIKSKSTEYNLRKIETINYHTNHFYQDDWKEHDPTQHIDRSSECTEWAKESERRLREMRKNTKGSANPNDHLDYLSKIERAGEGMSSWVVATSKVTFDSSTRRFEIMADAYFSKKMLELAGK